MNNTKAPRNGISYTLNGERVNLSASDSNNRVRMMRVAQAKGAQDICQHINGKTYPTSL